MTFKTIIFCFLLLYSFITHSSIAQGITDTPEQYQRNKSIITIINERADEISDLQKKIKQLEQKGQNFTNEINALKSELNLALKNLEIANGIIVSLTISKDSLSKINGKKDDEITKLIKETQDIVNSKKVLVDALKRLEQDSIIKDEQIRSLLIDYNSIIKKLSESKSYILIDDYLIKDASSCSNIKDLKRIKFIIYYYLPYNSYNIPEKLEAKIFFESKSLYSNSNYFQRLSLEVYYEDGKAYYHKSKEFFDKEGLKLLKSNQNYYIKVSIVDEQDNQIDHYDLGRFKLSD